MQYILWAAGAIVFATALAKTQRRRAKTKPLRRAVLDQNIVYRTRVDAKYVTNIGSWSIKTLGGMELIVRTNTFQVSLVFPVLGGWLGSEWYFKSDETKIEWSSAPSHRILDRNWIIIRGTENGNPVEVAVWKRDTQDVIWGALVTSGALPS